MAHQQTTAIGVQTVDDVQLTLLFDSLGVNDLAHLAGALDRTVHLSPTSTLGCPAHGLTLKPDACRSCRLLDPTPPT
jgi:hypothetical protein